MPERPSVGDDARFMREALAEARAALAHDDVPVGAVVVREGAVISRGRNRREADRDPTAHAELIAIREAARSLGRWRLDDCALYVTVEPCAMCAGASVLARLGLVVFAAPEPRTGAVLSVAQLLDEPRLNHHPRWRMGTAREDAERLLREFFASHRDAAP
ncbi:MAG TPA: nucleoside deaminase [Candidatus Limnocylindria bacterium]|nr:nucleoside deaminase [Candidatus Limnocylindria bacterium]